MMGNRQIDAFVGSSGGAGCSKQPMPPAYASMIRCSTVNNNSKLPVSSCWSSLIAMAARPHRVNRSRRTRGAACCGRSADASTRLPLACDHVSQGGPARAPMTNRSRTAVSQKERTVGWAISPQTGSVMRSTDIVWIVVASWWDCIWSRKYWKSPGRRLPENAWMM